MCLKNEKIEGGRAMADSFSFEIVEHIAVLSENAKGWKKELNLVSWNGRPPKFDLRDWDSEHAKMGKGITLTNEELAALKSTLEQMQV
ncbi:hypothetical protein RT42_GL000850 [Enterococcus cecorum DSM 20682 = ATCC 43198]|nr:hypothetical protein RT42_GL000850 [Enterococcus cecorum DSM 20682 = ATCC 43198]